MKFPAARLLIFSKSPEAGQVKTRLVPLLGAPGAAAYSASLVHHCLDKCTTAGLCPVELWCSPSSATPFFHGCRVRYGIELHEQTGADLGQRMFQALDSALARCDSAVLIGTDCPALRVTDLEDAFTALQQGSGAVIGPARDGGYYLIGLRQAQPRLFSNIAWGTDGVFRETVVRLEQLGLEYTCLPEREDVDTPEDYLRAVAPDPARAC